jgi:hypothetical protein
MTSKSKHAVKYPDLPSAMTPVPHNGEFSVQKPPENLTYSDDISDSDEDRVEQEGDNVDCDPTFEASSYSSEPHLLTQGDPELLCP